MENNAAPRFEIKMLYPPRLTRAFIRIEISLKALSAKSTRDLILWKNSSTPTLNQSTSACVVEWAIGEF